MPEETSMTEIDETSWRRTFWDILRYYLNTKTTSIWNHLIFLAFLFCLRYLSASLLLQIIVALLNLIVIFLFLLQIPKLCWPQMKLFNHPFMLNNILKHTCLLSKAKQSKAKQNKAKQSKLPTLSKSKKMWNVLLLIILLADFVDTTNITIYLSSLTLIVFQVWLNLLKLWVVTLFCFTFVCLFNSMLKR